MTMEATAHRRHRSVSVQVGRVTVGGDAPIVVQSMTNTDTADAAATATQVAALAQAGSEIVRITVDRNRFVTLLHRCRHCCSRGSGVPDLYKAVNGR